MPDQAGRASKQLAERICLRPQDSEGISKLPNIPSCPSVRLLDQAPAQKSTKSPTAVNRKENYILKLPKKVHLLNACTLPVLRGTLM